MGEVVVAWPAARNEHGRPMLWFGSWLVGNAGCEGNWFYSGRGGERTAMQPPPEATGIRVRRWPNEGLDAEYADILSLAGVREIAAATLDFDAQQAYSVLRSDE